MKSNTATIDPDAPLPTAPNVDLQEIRDRVHGPGYGSGSNPIRDGSADELEASRLFAQERKLATLKQTPTAALPKIDDELAELEEKRAKLEARKAQEFRNIETWRSMREKRDWMEQQLARADAEFASFYKPKERLAEVNAFWEQQDVTTNGMFTQYAAIYALELVQVEFPKWRAGYVAKIEALKKEIAEYIAEKNIHPAPPAAPKMDPSEFTPKRYEWKERNAVGFGN